MAAPGHLQVDVAGSFEALESGGGGEERLRLQSLQREGGVQSHPRLRAVDGQAAFALALVEVHLGQIDGQFAAMQRHVQPAFADLELAHFEAAGLQCQIGFDGLQARGVDGVIAPVLFSASAGAGTGGGGRLGFGGVGRQIGVEIQHVHIKGRLDRRFGVADIDAEIAGGLDGIELQRRLG